MRERAVRAAERRRTWPWMLFTHQADRLFDELSDAIEGQEDENWAVVDAGAWGL